MRLRSLLVGLLAILVLPWLAPLARGADDVTFEEGIEFSNPDNQHLQLNLAQPKPIKCDRDIDEMARAR